MYSVPDWPDRSELGSPNPGISPKPITSSTGSASTSAGSSGSRKNSFVSIFVIAANACGAR